MFHTCKPSSGLAYPKSTCDYKKREERGRKKEGREKKKEGRKGGRKGRREKRKGCIGRCGVPSMRVFVLPMVDVKTTVRSHIKGNPDLTKSALQARFYQLKPFLNFNPDIITPEIQNAYLTTWCKNSVLGSFQQRKLVFHPLRTPQTSHQS